MNRRILQTTLAEHAGLWLGSLSLLTLVACGPEAQFEYHNRDPKPSPLVNWPKATADHPVDMTIRVRDHFDGKMQRFYGVDDLGSAGQEEDQPPIFDVGDGGVVENVILGDPAADGIHCSGACTLRNVWWERVGEDAATFRQTIDEQVSVIDGGGAAGAMDKVFQHNGRGTVHIRNFYVETFGKLYRSCGNCSRQSARHVIIENVTAVTWKKTAALVGVNENFGDTAEFRGLSHLYEAAKEVPLCQRYIGNSTGLEPKKSGEGADGRACRYTDANIASNK